MYGLNIAVKGHISFLLTSFLIVSSLNSTASAAEWTVTPSITGRQIYSDNITLASQNEEQEFVTEVSPGLLVVGEGGRFDLNLNYNLQAVLFPSGNFDNDVNHQLSSSGTGELIEQLFFVDVDGSVSQINASNTDRQAADNIAQTGNRINTVVYRVSPFLVNRFGSFATSELRYGFAEEINEGDTVDNESRSINGKIDSGSRFGRFPWQIFGQKRDITFDDGIKTEFWEAGASLSYVFGRNISVFGRGGYEFQDFGTTRGEEEGIFWELGATWTPSARTSLEASYGERFFGQSFSFDVNYTRRRMTLVASFSEDISFSADEILSDRRITDTRVRILTDLATPTSEVIVSQRFDGAVTFSGERTNVGFSGFHVIRDFQDTREEETVFGSSTTISRRLSQRLSLIIGGRWEETKFRDSVREDTRWETSIALSRSIRSYVEGSIEYRYTDLDSNEVVNEFKENRVTVTLRATF